ncbi:MurR/RpiR family transcriptional regulator [Virgibacillus kekensis]|uniref:MurR/RpiR family transcriptional regulator n=1 Tax=Virgibacillus kekensis TaxID=202261 RepID=A0ABV9DKY0_9BACI
MLHQYGKLKRRITIEDIYQRVKKHQSTFSKGFKKVATYVYSDPAIFAVNSAKEAGRRIGVSETTIIRFANTIGFKGYSELQQELQQHLFQKSNLSSYQKRRVPNQTSPDSIKEIMYNDITNIQTVVNQIPDDDLERAVTKLTDSDQVFVAGVRSSFALASWFAYALDIVVGDARQYLPNDNILIRISELTNKSVFVAFSFHRYGVTTINLAKMAKKQGATVIAFSDTPYSPISEIADIILPIQLKDVSTLDLVPVLFSLLNSIISTIITRKPELFEQRVAMFDAVEAEDFFP